MSETATAEHSEGTDGAAGTEQDAFGARIGAFLIDWTVLSVAAFVVWLAFFALRVGLGMAAMGAADPGTAPGAGAGAGDGVMAGVTLVGLLLRVVMWLVVFGVVGGYFVLLDGKFGQTLGKRLLDVEVRMDDGSDPSTGAVAKRTAVLLAPAPLMVLVYFVPLIGFFLSLAVMAVWLLVEVGVAYTQDRRKRLGDRVAGTVVREEPITG